MSPLDGTVKIPNLSHESTIDHYSGDSLPVQRTENERVSP